MVLNVQIPAEIEAQLRLQTSDLAAEAKEAMFVEFYRQEKISRYQLSVALGLGRFETDAVLKWHNVTEDLPTQEELAQDLVEASRLVKR